MRTWVVALAAGVLAALLVSGIPASAADQQVAAQPSSTWSPKDVTVASGESVTWSNPSGGFHNVCVAKPGLDPSAGCGEFRNGDVGSDWSSYTNAHTFTAPGTYKFQCQAHGSSMAGTVTVPGSGTGTTTETITDTTPTQTTPGQTTPTQTTPAQTTPAADTTAPLFTGKLKHKSSRKALKVELGSSEDATLQTTVSRRAPGARSFKRVGGASLAVKAGRNTVTLPRKAAGKVRKGAYRVKLLLVDPAGNRSGTRVLSFKIS